MFKITIVKVETEDKGKYSVIVVTHKTAEGKVDARRVVSFGEEKDTFQALSKAKQGEVYEITAQKILNPKDGKEYWRWTAATPSSLESNNGGAGSNVAKVRGGFETPEERAARQVYIVRQSSIANAISFFGPGKSPDISEVLAVAKQFEAYVFSTPEVV